MGTVALRISKTILIAAVFWYSDLFLTNFIFSDYKMYRYLNKVMMDIKRLDIYTESNIKMYHWKKLHKSIAKNNTIQ